MSTNTDRHKLLVSFIHSILAGEDKQESGLVNVYHEIAGDVESTNHFRNRTTKCETNFFEGYRCCFAVVALRLLKPNLLKIDWHHEK